MKRLCALGIAVVLSFSPVTDPWLEASEKNPVTEDQKNQTIRVEIDYGGQKPARTAEALQTQGETVLEVLQSIAVVETHPVGKYVFVTAIDGIHGKRGDMAWYYQIDGCHPGELAWSKPADGIKAIRWMYQKDVCSPKTDVSSTLKKEGGKAS